MDKINLKNIILERIKELENDCEWCVYQINGENRINKSNDPKKIHHWSTHLQENKIRIDELYSIYNKLN